MANYMNEACIEANKGLENKDGGPFGAVIVKDDEIIASGHNTVLATKDPTAHAEVNAIRKASKILNNYDLSECILYTTSEPCPMCMSAIIWANIKTVYYGTDRKEVANIGFRDDYIYEYLKDKNDIDIKKEQLKTEECEKLLKSYKNTIY